MGQNANATGCINVYQLEKNSLKTIATVANDNGFKCGTFDASVDGTQLATGDFQGNLSVWDLNNFKAPIWSQKGHRDLINHIDGIGGLIGKGSPELVTCGKDGSVHIWDIRQQRPTVSFEPEIGQDQIDCWAAAFGNSYDANQKVLSIGYDNGDVKIIDLRKNKLIWENNFNNGIVSIAFDRKDILMNKMSLTTLSGSFLMCDMRCYHPEKGFTSKETKIASSTCWGSYYLPQNRDIFATTYGDGTLALHKYSYPKQRAVKDESGLEYGVVGTSELLNSQAISTQPIVSFDWHTEKTGLACTAALDQSLRVIISTRLNLF